MSETPGLPFDTPAEAPDFDGATYVEANDRVRLGGQSLRVWSLMRDGAWRTLGEIEAATGDPQASISARLRDYRKKRFGEHELERRHRGEPVLGLYEYRIVINPIGLARLIFDAE